MLALNYTKTIALRHDSNDFPEFKAAFILVLYIVISKNMICVQKHYFYLSLCILVYTKSSIYKNCHYVQKA